MEKQLTVDELYQCLALLQGVSITNNDTKETSVQILGFANEKNISEGMRRIANKTIKKLKENYPEDQFKAIQAKTLADLYDGPLPEGYVENVDYTIKLANLKQGQVKELAESQVTINFDELPDFAALDARLEARAESLSFNYTYLFERLFLNY